MLKSTIICRAYKSLLKYIRLSREISAKLVATLKNVGQFLVAYFVQLKGETSAKMKILQFYSRKHWIDWKNLGATSNNPVKIRAIFVHLLLS